MVFNFEEVDLCWRLTLAGYENVFTPSTEVLHLGGRTTNASAGDERARRFHLVNHHAIQLKVVGYGAWPFIFARFEFLAAKYALTAGGWSAFRDYYGLNRMLIQRLSTVRRHRKILSEHHHAGKETFRAMTNQQRFPVA